jgi:putative acetyltransferase
MHFRLATDDDLPALAALYSNTVRTLGPALYTADQVRVWSASPDHAERFRGFILEAHTLVALTEASPLPLGFAGLEPDGRIASLYVRADHCRQGIGSALLAALIEKAAADGLSKLRTEASKFSRPVFERFGFELDEVERGLHHGVPFARFLMSRGV